jgi:hypothetical protein
VHARMNDFGRRRSAVVTSGVATGRLYLAGHGDGRPRRILQV